MIPFVSLRCSRRGSLSQLSLDGLKLPGQVYSAVTPCAAGAGRAELSRPDSYLQVQPWTLRHRDPPSPLRCLTCFIDKFLAATELPTPLTLACHKCCLALYFSLHFCCLITACFGFACCRQKQTECNAANVSHFRRLLLPHSENTMVASHVVAPHLQRTHCKER